MLQPVGHFKKQLIKKNRILFMVTLSSEEFSFFDIEFNVALNSSLILTIFWYPNYKKIVKAFSKISKMIFDFQATITKQSSLQS